MRQGRQEHVGTRGSFRRFRGCTETAQKVYLSWTSQRGTGHPPSLNFPLGILLETEQVSTSHPKTKHFRGIVHLIP